MKQAVQSHGVVTVLVLRTSKKSVAQILPQYNEGKNCPEDFSVTLKGKCIAKMCNIAIKYMQ